MKKINNINSNIKFREGVLLLLLFTTFSCYRVKYSKSEKGIKERLASLFKKGRRVVEEIEITGVGRIEIERRNRLNESQIEILRAIEERDYGKLVLAIKSSNRSDYEKRIRLEGGEIKTLEEILMLSGILEETNEGIKEILREKKLNLDMISKAEVEDVVEKRVVRNELSEEWQRIIKKGDIEKVRKLLSKSNVKAGDDFWTAKLMLAAKCGNREIVELLIPLSDVNTIGEDDKTLLMLAVESGNAELVKMLIPLSDVKAKVDWGEQTALMFAALGGNKEIVEMLLPLSNAIDADEEGKTTLMYAAEGGNREIVEMFLPLSDIKAVDKEGETLLMFAVKGKNKEVVDMFLSFSDVKAKNSEDKTALIFAAEDGNREIVEILLPLSDVKAVDEYGRTAIMYAVESGNKEVVELLIPLSDVQRVITDDHYKGFIRDKRILLSTGEYYKNKTLLMFAIIYGHKEIVELLLPLSDIKAIDEYGYNFAHYLSYYNNLDENFLNIIFLYLVKEVSNIKDSTFRTNNFEAHRYCGVKYDQIMNQRRQNNSSPFDIACNEGNIEFVNFFLDKYESSERGSDEEMVCELIIFGRQIEHIEDEKEENRSNGLHYAVDVKNIGICKRVLNSTRVEVKAMLNQKNEEGDSRLNNQTPLTLADRLGFKEFVELVKSREHSSTEEVSN